MYTTTCPVGGVFRNRSSTAFPMGHIASGRLLAKRRLGALFVSRTSVFCYVLSVGATLTYCRNSTHPLILFYASLCARIGSTSHVFWSVSIFLLDLLTDGLSKQWLKTSNTCPMCRAHVSNPPAPGDRSSSRLRTSRISRPVELQELLYDPPPRRTRSTVTFSRHRSTPGPGPSSSSATPAPAATSTDSAAQPQASAAAQRTYAHALSRAVASLQEPSPPPLPVTPSSSNVPPPLRSPGTPPRFIWYDAIPARRNARHGQSSEQNQGQQSQQTREGDANGERRPERRDERGPGEGGSGRERQPSVD